MSRITSWRTILLSLASSHLAPEPETREAQDSTTPPEERRAVFFSVPLLLLSLEALAGSICSARKTTVEAEGRYWTSDSLRATSAPLRVESVPISKAVGELSQVPVAGLNGVI